MHGASTEILIDVPPKVIYDVVIDFESYPEFLPDVKKAIVEKEKGKQIIASFEISVIKKIHYTLLFTPVPGKKISWNFVKGDLFKSNQGCWQFEEVKKGQTRATYRIEVDFGFMVPQIISNKLIGNNLPAMMKKFKDRAEGLL